MKHHPVFSSNTQRIFLNGIALIVYFSVFIVLGGVSSETMHFSNDAHYYFHYGDWIFGEAEATGHIQIRPFLFPLFLKIGKLIGGYHFVWFCQFLMWIGTINLVFSAVKHATKRSWTSWIVALIIISNFSFIALTLHGLTEVSTLFLISIFLYQFSRNRHSILNPKFISTTVLLLVLLTLIRPVFNPLLLLFLFTLVPYAIWKTQRSLRKHFAVILIYLLPLLFQVGLMKVQFDTYSISNISGETFKNYFFTKGYADINGIEYKAALSHTIDFSQEEIWAYISDHPSAYFEQYTTNLDGNLRGNPDFLSAPVNAPKLFRYMQVVNEVYYRLHIIFGSISVILSFVFLFKKRWKNVQLLTILLAPLFLIILSSGISFWQGDRLMLPSLPIWSALYVYLIYAAVSALQNRKKVHG